jgi:hypothetical protein
VKVLRAQTALGDTGLVNATDLKGLSLGEAPFNFKSGSGEAEAVIDLPVEIRNDVARLEIVGERSAGAVQLLDKRWRRRTVGVVSGSTADRSQPLIGATYYLSRALNPFADVSLSEGLAPTEAISRFLERHLPMLILADVGNVTDALDRLNKWIDNGGVFNPPYFIDKITDANGTVIYEHTPNPTQAMSEQAAREETVAMQAVVTGEVCCIMNQVQTVLGQWRAGKVRLLGVTTRQRVGAVQEVPTIDEAGLPGYESYIWFGLFGPKGLDAAITEKINLAVKNALDLPAIREKLVGLGNAPRYETVDQFRATVKADRAKWADVVKASGASID